MPTATALKHVIGFVVTAKPDEARRFYGDVLGLRLLTDDAFALAFDAHGTMIRVTKAKTHTPAQGTVLGWEVPDLHAAIRELVARGVAFEQFGLPFITQDEHGAWLSPNGDRVAWFKDPDGNTLSLSQHVGR